VGVHGVEPAGQVVHELGDAGAIGGPRSFEVEVGSVHSLGPDGGDDVVGQGLVSGLVVGQLIQSLLVEALDAEHHPVAGGVGAGDEVGQGLALVAVPPAP